MTNKRHNAVYTFLRPVFRFFFRLAFRYRAAPAPSLPTGQPAIVLANHNCAWDPFFIALSFRRAIYYIASDHIFRLGLASAIIRFLVAPIPIVKSQIDLKTLRQVRDCIRAGGIVGLFPEGNRSFNGLLGRIPPATGKLVKHLGCPLYLYKIRGGYLSTPRWSRHARRGRMSGEVVRVLSAAELAALSPAEVNALIRDVLDTDAYREQRQNPVLYRGRRLAEYLERVLFICPGCRGLATLRSHGSDLDCRCGLHVRIGPDGFFQPVDEVSRQRAQQGDFLDSVAARP
jgi:1-acyl-sn-glycerol-3-phosphate acyltransferase